MTKGKASTLLVTWIPSSKETWGHVVDWVPDTDKRGDLSWIRLPPENLSVLLPGETWGPPLVPNLEFGCMFRPWVKKMIWGGALVIGQRLGC